MNDLFPLGWQHYLFGGLLVGGGTALVFLATGIRAGASGFFSSTLSLLFRGKAFQDAEMVRERSWRMVFTIGLVLGAALYTFVWGESFTTGIGVGRLFLGGILVGLGTRLSRGCTSGHGICGMSSGARSSVVAVLVFMAVAILVAQLTRAVGIAS